MTLIRLEFVKHLNVIQILIHIQYRLNVYQVKVTFTPVLKLIIKHNIQPPSVGLWRQIQVRHNLFNNHRAVNRSVTDTIVKWTVKDFKLILIVEDKGSYNCQGDLLSRSTVMTEIR